MDGNMAQLCQHNPTLVGVPLQHISAALHLAVWAIRGMGAHAGIAYGFLVSSAPAYSSARRWALSAPSEEAPSNASSIVDTLAVI